MINQTAKKILKALSFDGVEVEAFRHMADLKRLDPMKIFYKKIDEKIELNNQINDNLLEVIKTLYTEKIKNNNDTNFEYRTLDEFCNIFTGKKNADFRK